MYFIVKYRYSFDCKRKQSIIESWKFMNHRDKKYRRILEFDISRALQYGEFEIYLQPQVNVSSKKIIGFEALLRWKHPHFGMLEPGQFLSVITYQKIKEEIDYYVFERVCALLYRRFCEGKKLFTVSCNFIREHFMKPDFVKKIQNIREKYGIPPQYLVLEIVEGKAFSFEGIVQRNVDELNRLGYPICLDDCGAGNSTMSDLLFRSITHIKIDKKVIDQIDHENVQILVNGLCSIANQLSCKTVCEGVETWEQLEIAKRCGVEVIQGFYFYHPMDIAKAEHLYDTAYA